MLGTIFSEPMERFHILFEVGGAKSSLSFM